MTIPDTRWWWLAFDPQSQRVHLDDCPCRRSEHSFSMGSSSSLSPSRIESLVEEDGGPHRFSIASCIKEARRTRP